MKEICEVEEEEVVHLFVELNNKPDIHTLLHI